MAGVPARFLLNSLAGLIILGIVTVTGFSVWLAADSRDLFGPTVLASGGSGDVYFNLGPELFRLDAQGELLDRVEYAELGIEGRHPTDLLELEDGTLLIGLAVDPDILACRLQERRCAGWLQGDRRPQSSFKMARDAARDRLLVVDGERHRILLYDGDGIYQGERGGGARGLKFPNTAWLSPAGELVVADTNHHRLVALDAETLQQELWEFPVDNDLGNFRRIWPTDFVQTPVGDYWAIIDDDLLEHGDVIQFDASRAPLRRVDLPDDWDPVKMRARTHDVLLAGYGSVELVSVSLDGAVVQPFGGAAVRAALEQVRAVRMRNDRWWGLWIWAALVPLGLLASVVGWLDYRRRQQVQAGTVAAARRERAQDTFPESVDGVYWLVMKPVVATRLRVAQRGMFVLPLLLLALFVSMFTVFDPGQVTALAGLLLLATLPFVAIISTGFRAMTGGRLGVTRDQVVLARGDDPRKYFSPRQLVWSRNFVSSGNITVYTRNGWGPLYDVSDMQDMLQPRLAGARRLNAWQGHMFLLRAGEPLAWATTLGLLCMAGLMVYVELFQ